MTLNGWQRLWVVLSVLWLFVVCTIGIVAWPMPASVPHGEVYLKMVNVDHDGARFVDFVPALTAVGAEPQKGTVVSFDPNWGTSQEGPHGATIDVGGHRLQLALRDMPDSDVNRAVGEYYAALRKVLVSKRITFTGQLAAVWLIPLAALYALGLSVGWVRRGFVETLKRDFGHLRYGR